MGFGGCWRSLRPQKWIWEWYSLHIWIAFDFAFPIRYIMIGLLQVWFWRLLEVKILEVNWHIWIAFDLAFPMIYIMIGLFDVGFWRLLEVKIFLEANVNMMYHFGILRPNAKQLWSWNLKNLEKNHFDLNLRLKEAKFQTCFFMALITYLKGFFSWKNKFGICTHARVLDPSPLLSSEAVFSKMEAAIPKIPLLS